jgi:hypothetical protein
MASFIFCSISRMLHPAWYQKTSMMYNTWFAKRSRKRLRAGLLCHARTLEFTIGIAIRNHVRPADPGIEAASRSTPMPGLISIRIALSREPSPA